MIQLFENGPCSGPQRSTLMATAYSYTVEAQDGAVIPTQKGPVLKPAGVVISFESDGLSLALCIPYEEMDRLRHRLTRAQDALLRQEGVIVDDPEPQV